MAANPPPMAQVVQMTRWVLMPVTSARSGLSAVARMALPILVRVSSRYTETTSMIATAATNMLSGGIRTSNGR